MTVITTLWYHFVLCFFIIASYNFKFLNNTFTILCLWTLNKILYICFLSCFIIKYYVHNINQCYYAILIEHCIDWKYHSAFSCWWTHRLFLLYWLIYFVPLLTVLLETLHKCFTRCIINVYCMYVYMFIWYMKTVSEG